MQALQASECMRQSSHNFAVFSLRTIPTIGELMRSRSPCYSLPPRPIHRCVDVQLLMSPLTEADVDFWRRHPPLMMTTHRSSWNFTLTGTISLLVLSHFACSMTNSSQYSSSTKPCGFNSNFHWKLASKASEFSNDVCWLDSLSWHHTPQFASDARSIQISSQDICISC